MADRLTERAHRVLDLAREEAGRFGHAYVGPEHVVLGLLRDGASGAASLLRARGLDLEAARAGLGRLVERGVVPGPRPNDAELLGSLGIDLDAVRRRTERTFGRLALGRATREPVRARRNGVGRVPRTPLQGPPVLTTQVTYLASQGAKALGQDAVGPELLLLGVVEDVRTPWPRCMWNRWQRRLWASVGLPERYRGAAGPLLLAFGVDLAELRSAVLAELNQTVL
ncbi:MAG TPA: Clp protease N-terminal domain-containing protein [Actinomycetes bacterium]|nr:Clp protease N-terminal domain-containing protein [Actinomycetes bacterium]